MDIQPGRSIHQSASQCDGSCTGDAPKSHGCRKSQVVVADHSRSAKSLNHRYSTSESRCGLCSGIQSDLIYGTPYVIPMYTPPVAIVTPGIFLDTGIGIGGGWGGFGWGWNSWRCSWGGGGNIIYNNNIYINKTTNTFNNYHPWGPGTPGQGPGGFGPGNGGYHPTGGGFGPGSGGYHPTGGTAPIGPARPGGLNPPGPGGGYHPTGGGMNPISPADPGRPSSPGNYHPMGGGGLTPGNVPSRPGDYRPSAGFSPSHNYNPTYGDPQRGANGNGFGRNNAMGASRHTRRSSSALVPRCYEPFSPASAYLLRAQGRRQVERQNGNVVFLAEALRGVSDLLSGLEGEAGKTLETV